MTGRNRHIGSLLEEFLAEDGILEEMRAAVVAEMDAVVSDESKRLPEGFPDDDTNPDPRG